MSRSAIPGRPNRPIVVKCGYEGSSRRVNFPSAATCRLESVRQRVEECFHLSASPFSLAYTDDDGELFSIRSEADLTEAISYFLSGDDTQSIISSNGVSRSVPRSPQKISIKLDVIVDYDGPSLSDTSSILTFESGSGSGSGSGSSGSWGDGTRNAYSIRSGEGLTDYTPSVDFSKSQGGESSSRQSRSNLSSDLTDRVDDISLNGRSRTGAGSISRARFTRSGSQSSQETYLPQPGQPRNAHSQRGASITGHALPPLTGPDSAPAPELLTNSELGSRWLREQSKLVRRKVAAPSTRRYESDEESMGSDESSLGDLSLVKDARGRYYYAYENADTISLATRSEAFQDQAGPSNHALYRQPSNKSLAASYVNAPAEYPPEPILAPDCTACGTRLSYMRYVCIDCGEADMWQENDVAKNVYTSSDTGHSEGSGKTAFPAKLGQSTGTPRPRSESTSTNASRDSIQTMHGREVESVDSRGYELCPSCIEAHGIEHSKPPSLGAGRLGRRHTFREKVWGPQGWQDVEYNEETQCRICNSFVLEDRYKCVSCNKFDLCKPCYSKVEEIHPSHVFLSLPEMPLPPIGSSLDSQLSAGPPPAPRPIAIRHPGAFCHNCLKDIVGPRFHCAVCPSWDLCDQCEGSAIEGPNSSGHTADHIMMKIPVPLANSEIAAVSRRARDRWLQQDSTAVTSNEGGQGRSRSPSPTNETIYAGGGTVRSGGSRLRPAVRIPRSAAPGDAMDHGCRCDNCNEWIMGRRFQCANCPSDPKAFNLCSICETRSYRVHDARHVFFKFERPVDIPLMSNRPLLPILYKGRVGDVSREIEREDNDPTAYLKHVLHRETLCDIHADQIRGQWLRCGHCAAGFDICQEAEEIALHDPSHVFIVFKAKVDMSAFRALADLASDNPKPLLRDQVYFTSEQV